MNNKIFAFISITAFLLSGSPAIAATNLILNPTFATHTGDVAPNWINGFFGAASGAVFHIVPGQDDNAAGEVSVATYSGVPGQGSAEWIFDNVPVTPGATYTFSDWYKSDATSYLTAQWVVNGTTTTRSEAMGTLAQTSGAWTQTTQYFTAPSDVSAVTIIHSLQSAGTLDVDNFSLSQGVSISQGALSKGIVSLTFDDGLTSQYDNGFPILKAAGLPGTFYIISSALNGSTYDFFTDPNQSIGTQASANSVAWTPIFTDPGVQNLRFQDTYTASDASTISVDYCAVAVDSVTGACPAGQAQTLTAGTLPAGTNAHANVTFTLPKQSGGASTVTPIKITHQSGSVMSASAPSLTELGLYMTPANMLDLQSNGEEIGAHTIDHCDLNILDITAGANAASCANTPVGSTTAQQQITGSVSALLGFGATLVNTLAYPYGGYNAHVESLTQGAGMIGARSVDIGYNTALTDKYAIKTESVEQVTDFTTVKSWIDQAIANKLWLTLLFHDVDSDANLTANGETFGTTPQTLQQIVDYLKSQQTSGSVQVLTLRDALNAVNGPGPDIIPPVIAAHADVFATTTVATSTAVSYTNPTATDNVDASVTVTCAPVSGSLFAIGSTTVTCTAHDVAGNNATPTHFTVNVIFPDIVPPVITAHADVTAEATSSAGVAVMYSPPVVTDNIDVPTVASCIPPPGSLFALASTTVTCNAHDAAGNNATSTAFAIRVVDTTAPHITVPTVATTSALTASGAPVIFSVASSTDAVDGTDTVTCDKNSGDTFPIGSTLVHCNSTDTHGNAASASFNVLVIDPNGPTISVPTIPAMEATSASGTPVTYDEPTATDLADGTDAVTCDAHSGDMFALGATTVHCSSTDKDNNTTQATFAITVHDTTAPAITLAGDNPTHVAQGSSYTEPGATAIDAVDGTDTVGIAGSVDGLTVGTYIITYTSTDTAGNTATSTRDVIVAVPAPNPIAVIFGGGGGGGGNGPIVGIFNSIGNFFGSVLGAFTSNVPSTTTPTTTFRFTHGLVPGMRGNDVVQLQQLLIDKGYLKIAKPTGYYGMMTMNAVLKFQADNNIPQLGGVGPLTRAALNAILAGGIQPTTATPGVSAVKKY